MRVYLGQSRGNGKMSRRKTELGFGECCNRGEYPPRHRPWFLDNGAYSDWQFKVDGIRVGRPFDNAAFLRDLEHTVADDSSPDFVVCPDRVATGRDSLAFSLDWLASYGSRFPGLRWRLAVQDGMTETDVLPVMHLFEGIFVGGTTEWKLETGAAWVRFAHSHGKPCHIGRAGREDHACWALRIGADSLDSSLPLWADANFMRFMRGLSRGRPQAEMQWGPTRDQTHSTEAAIQDRPVESGARRRSRVGGRVVVGRGQEQLALDIRVDARPGEPNRTARRRR